MSARQDESGSDALTQTRTLQQLFAHRVAQTPEADAYHWHDAHTGCWRSMNWRQAGERVAQLRQALHAEGLSPGDRVGLLLRNCPDWILFDMAAQGLGLVTVPFYTDDRPENAAYICRHAGIRLLLIQDAGRWQSLTEALAEDDPLERVLLWEDNRHAGELARDLMARDKRLRLLEDWLAQSNSMGAPGSSLDADGQSGSGSGAIHGPSDDAPARPVPTALPDDPQALATIIYTSGTTGRPKGVMLSHQNLISNAAGALSLVDVQPDDRFLSFLPLSHGLERTGGAILPMMSGASIAFARSIGQLGEDLKQVQPTLMIAVPRVFERVYQRIQTRVAKGSALKRWLFELGVSTGWHQFLFEQGRGSWHPRLLLWPLLRRLVSRPVMEGLGGRMRAAVSGGAPLPPEVARFFIGLGLSVLQGYGLTEASPVISVNPIEDNEPESVGRLLPGVQARLAKDDELEVLGPGNMLGYWQNPAASAEVLDAGGWLRTGDQVRLEGDRLFITGRLKDILVLSNGEKVPPGDMQTALALEPWIDQVLVIGEGHAYLSALVVLDPDAWKDLALQHGLDPEDPHSLSNDRLKLDLLRRMRQRLTGFPGYAKIRRLHLTLEPWTIENDLLTPTQKIRRAQVLARYRSQIEALYALESMG